MTPTAAGRHCAACATTVTDFTRHTGAELLAHFRRAGAGRVCGRFRATQATRQPRLLTWPATPWRVLSLVVALTLTHCSPERAVAPVGPGTTRPGHVSVTGTVLDEKTGLPLSNAWIVCEQDTAYHTRTTADGSFTLSLPGHLLGSKLIAAALYSGQPEADAEGLETEANHYIPHYFAAEAGAVVLLRRPPSVLGRVVLQPGETYSPAILSRLCPAMPPPPPPNLMKFTLDKAGEPD